MVEKLSLSDEDLPGLFKSADRSSVRSQRSYMTTTRIRLLLAVAAAGAGVFTWRIGSSQIDWLGVVSLLLFVLALIADIGLLKNRPDRDWYQSRAVAESVKTLSWKYAVGGAPYVTHMPEFEARALLVNDFRSVTINAQLPASHGVVGGVATDAMSQLRAEGLSVRKRSYLYYRIEDQQRWYAAKAERKAKASRLWRAILIILEVLGVLGSIAKATGLLDISLDGLIATAIAAAGAWLEARRDEQTARAYVVTSADLSIVHSNLELAADETSWSRAVADAEDAISREHTMWKAARAVA